MHREPSSSPILTKEFIDSRYNMTNQKDVYMSSAIVQDRQPQSSDPSPEKHHLHDPLMPLEARRNMCG